MTTTSEGRLRVAVMAVAPSWRSEGGVYFNPAFSHVFELRDASPNVLRADALLWILESLVSSLSVGLASHEGILSETRSLALDLVLSIGKR